MCVKIQKIVGQIQQKLGKWKDQPQFRSIIVASQVV